MRILFEGRYYSGAGTIILTQVVTLRWCQVMEHKCAWTPVVDQELTCIAFSQHAQEFHHQYLDQILTDDPRELRFSQLLLPRGPNYLNGWVWILYEGGYYLPKYGTCIAHQGLVVAHTQGQPETRWWLQSMYYGDIIARKTNAIIYKVHRAAYRACPSLQQ